MTRSTYMLFATLLVGCNLFTGVDGDHGQRDAGPSDMPTADSTSNSTTDGVQTGDSMVRDTSVQDTPTPDTCTLLTDAELCASLDACGSPRSPMAGAIRTEIEAESAPAAECGIDSGYVVLCNSTGTVHGDVDLGVDGDYRIELLAEAQQLGEPPAIAELQVDGEVAALIAVLAERGEPQTYSVELPLTAGTHAIRWRFANDAVLSGGDRNLYIDRFAVEGPLGPFVDSCGQERTIDCGTCQTNEVCGYGTPNRCGCPCPLGDGTCAPPGPHASDPCLECGPDGWLGVGGSCSDGNSCTNDSCDVRTGICLSSNIVCRRGECEVGSCSGGNCQYSDAGDGTACGVGGVCSSGECGCADGVTVETSCNDNQDNDCDGLENCLDPDCEGLTCQGQKVCTGGACL